jgi:hypothetical protein
MVCPFNTKRRHTPLFFAYLQGVFNLRSIMSQIIADFAQAENALLDRCEAAILILHNGGPAGSLSNADKSLLTLLAARQTAITVELETLSNGGVSDGSGVIAGVPVIAIPLAVTGTVGQPFSFQIQASNSPTSYSAEGLPVWATIDTASGIITGTPTVAGVSAVKINAANAAGQGLDPTLTITVS